MLDPLYTRRLTPDEEGGFTATIHEFPGCVAEGETAEEALANLEKAAAAWIKAATETGFKVPSPVDFDGASGKIALRVSRRIHREAMERASLEGISLNQLVSVAVASYLGQQDGMVRCANMVREHLNIGFARFYSQTIHWERTVTAAERLGYASPETQWQIAPALPSQIKTVSA